MLADGARFTSAGALVLAWLCCGAAGCGSNQAPAEKQYVFWPAAPDAPRIQFLTSYGRSTDVELPRSGLTNLIYGKEPRPELPLNKPYGVKMWKGRIYVCDLRAAAVVILDLRKHQTYVMGKTGTQTLSSPSDIAIAPDGMKYVADVGRGMVFVFDADDRLQTTFKDKDWKPVGVAVYENELFVCDFKGQMVRVLDRTTGELKRTIGEPGSEDGQFVRPLGITFDSSGHLYVADLLKCQIQKFQRDGKLLTRFSGISASVGGLVRPKHIAIDRDGIIYAVDSAFQNVQLFNQVGQVFTFFGSGGDYPGAMCMPAGVSVHEEDLDLFEQYVHPAFKAERLILVTNQFGEAKVAVYALGQLRPGKTVKDLAGRVAPIPAGTGPGNRRGPGAPLPAGADEFKGTDSGPGPSTIPKTTQPER